MDKPKLVQLNTPRTAGQVEVIEALEDLLTRAKSGEFSGLAYAAARMNGEVVSSWTRLHDFHSLVGGLCVLQHCMITEQPVVTE